MAAITISATVNPQSNSTKTPRPSSGNGGRGAEPQTGYPPYPGYSHERTDPKRFRSRQAVQVINEMTGSASMQSEVSFTLDHEVIEVLRSQDEVFISLSRAVIRHYGSQQTIAVLSDRVLRAPVTSTSAGWRRLGSTRRPQIEGTPALRLQAQVRAELVRRCTGLPDS